MNRDQHVQWRALWEATRRDSEWIDRAACRTQPKAIFFPVDRARTGPARKICAACPVRTECLRDHVDEPEGIFGGLDPLERRRHNLGLRHAKCGTTAGYQWHVRHGEPTCGPCKEAHNAAHRNYMASRNGSAA